MKISDQHSEQCVCVLCICERDPHTHLNVVHNQRADVHQFGHRQHLGVIARVAADHVNAQQTRVGAPRLAAAIDDGANRVDDRLVERVDCEGTAKIQMTEYTKT